MVVVVAGHAEDQTARHLRGQGGGETGPPGSRQHKVDAHLASVGHQPGDQLGPSSPVNPLQCPQQVVVAVNQHHHPGQSATAQAAGSLALQAACLHSPEDLVITSIVPETLTLNEWLKWLPHVRSANSPLGQAHLAGNRQEADRLIQALTRVAEQRSLGRDQQLDRRWPWFLVLVDHSLEPEEGSTSRLLELSYIDRWAPTIGTYSGRATGPSALSSMVQPAAVSLSRRESARAKSLAARAS